MENTIATQLYSLFIFTMSGIIIGIFFDLFRVLRRSFRTPDIITYIEDICFWIFTGLFLLYILFTFQNGEIRSYVILGLLLGIGIYMLTISRYFIKINVKIITFFKEMIKKVVTIILYPFHLLLHILKNIFGKPISFLVINVKNISTNFNKKVIKGFKNIKNAKKTKKTANKKKEFRGKCRKI